MSIHIYFFLLFKSRTSLSLHRAAQSLGRKVVSVLSGPFTVIWRICRVAFSSAAARADGRQKLALYEWGLGGTIDGPGFWEFVRGGCAGVKLGGSMRGRRAGGLINPPSLN